MRGETHSLRDQPAVQSQFHHLVEGRAGVGVSGLGGGDPQDLLAAVAMPQTKSQETYNAPRARMPHGAWGAWTRATWRIGTACHELNGDSFPCLLVSPSPPYLGVGAGAC